MYCTNTPNTPTDTLHDTCVQMVGRDIVIDGCTADRVAAVNLPTEGRVSKGGQCSFDENSHGARSVAKLKEWKHNRVKRANPAFCSRCLYCEVLREARCDFLNTTNEKRLDFHRPADPLRAGVSQILFQPFFSLSSTLPSWRYCCPIQVLIRI